MNDKQQQPTTEELPQQQEQKGQPQPEQRRQRLPRQPPLPSAPPVHVATAFPTTFDEWNELRWRKQVLNTQNERLTPDEYTGYTLSLWDWVTAPTKSSIQQRNESTATAPAVNEMEVNAKRTDFYCRRVMQAFGACVQAASSKSKNAEANALRAQACQMAIPDIHECRMHQYARSMVENDFIHVQKLLSIGTEFPHRALHLTDEELLQAFKEVYIDRPETAKSHDNDDAAAAIGLLILLLHPLSIDCDKSIRKNGNMSSTFEHVLDSK